MPFGQDTTLQTNVGMNQANMGFGLNQQSQSGIGPSNSFATPRMGFGNSLPRTTMGSGNLGFANQLGQQADYSNALSNNALFANSGNNTNFQGYGSLPQNNWAPQIQPQMGIGPSQNFNSPVQQMAMNSNAMPQRQTQLGQYNPNPQSGQIAQGPNSSGPLPGTAPPTGIAPTSGMIQNWYNQYLGRPASTAEIQNWSNGNYTGNMDQIQNQIQNSGEAQQFNQQPQQTALGPRMQPTNPSPGMMYLM